MREIGTRDPVVAQHPSPTEIEKGALTPSSRRRLCRHHRHLLCRRSRLPPRPLLRRALVEGGHRQVPTDQKGVSSGILDIFCSYPMVRGIRGNDSALCPQRHSANHPQGRGSGEVTTETSVFNGVSRPRSCYRSLHVSKEQPSARTNCGGDSASQRYRVFFKVLLSARFGGLYCSSVTGKARSPSAMGKLFVTCDN